MKTLADRRNVCVTLNEEFADMLVDGAIRVVERELEREVRRRRPDLARLSMRFNLMSYHRLREFINALNRL